MQLANFDISTLVYIHYYLYRSNQYSLSVQQLIMFIVFVRAILSLFFHFKRQIFLFFHHEMALQEFVKKISKMCFKDMKRTDQQNRIIVKEEN